MRRKLTYLAALLLLGLTATGMSADPDPSLTGWWTFDGHALDISGNERHGTLNGSPQYVPGVFGEALEFQDNPDYVTIDGYKGVLGTSAFSITAWVKTSNPANIEQLVHWGADAGGQRVEFRINSNRLRISHGNGNVQGNTDLIDGQWHHVAAVVIENATASSGDVTFYVDGEDDTIESTDADGWDIVANDTLDVTIGYRPTRSDRPFIGFIDDLRIYNKVLIQEEIQQIMLSGGEPYPFASRPNPANGAGLEATWVDLTWSPGALALSHDVYIGDNFNDVNDGTGDTFIGNQAATSLFLGIPGFLYPEGLVPGTTYYWRIDEVNDTEPNSPWKGDVWSFSIPSLTAFNTNPVDGAKYIDPDVTLSWTAGFGAKLHQVYFGDNFDDVNSAVTGMSQAVTTYKPGTLEFDKTYYWRVDEFDGAATHKGQVISFSTMPVIDITDPNLIGWWKLDAGIGNVAPDWSGHGNHGQIVEPQWLIPGWIGESALNFGSGRYVAIRNLVLNDPNATEVSVSAWIRTSDTTMQTIVSFDRSEYWRLEAGDSQYAGPGKVGWEVSTSTGIVDLASQKLIDDGQWHHVAGVFDNGLMTVYIDGASDVSAMGGNTFGTGTARYGFIASQSEATAFDGDRSGSPGYFNGGLDDVRIYDKALTQEDIAQVMRGDLLLAWDLQPPSGTYDIETVPSSLSWKAGDMATEHDIYFGTDQQTVQSADASDTTGLYRGRQTSTIYVPPEDLAWGQTYYWRIDELNTDGTITKGGIRAIIVADFISIDDFESYNDLNPDEPESNRIFLVWIDGFDNPAINGSVIGYPNPPFTEQTIVHEGSQSMPYFYDNAVGNSEATLTLTGLRDWTKHDIELLSLWFMGSSANAPEPMYVALNGSAVVAQDNPNAALVEQWTEWKIDLQSFADQGVNLTNVNTIAIGFGDKNNPVAGGSGTVFFDDIRLLRPLPEHEPEPEPAP
ncbi:MAG: LamG domain-containing protein [Planctomycetes bacterium]|nr:LamG domain-containing protein [Planctomycetota bacterium]